MFDLDIVTSSIAVVSIIAFCIPFYIHSRNIKNRLAVANRHLEDFANNEQISLEKREIWRNQYFIGFDSQKGKLIYSMDISTASPQFIDLEMVNGVKIEEASHKVQSQVSSRKVIDKLDLVLIGEGGKHLYELEFYDGDKFSDLLGETVLIKKWETALKGYLQNKPAKALVL